MRNIWTDIHQVGNTFAALALGIALEEFTDLEEEHDEDGLRELRLCPRQETDAKGADGGDGHEEMLVEGIALQDALPSLMQRLVAYY